MSAPVRVGLVGAGPWANMYHAPMLAAGPETVLSGVWARRPEAAAELAGQHGVLGTDDFDDFLAECDAVAFAVPPDVQADLAPRAAAAGKPLLLEKPIALDGDAARCLVASVSDVPTQLMLTRRYSQANRAFLAAAGDFPTIGATAMFVSGAFLPGSPFATPWRLRHGALLDVGPHVLDLLDAAAGPIEHIEFTGDPRTWMTVVTRHSGGAVGQTAISSVVPGNHWELRLYGPEGVLAAPARDENERPQVMATIAAEFAEVVRSGQSHPIDVHRGLYLQELMERFDPPA